MGAAWPGHVEVLSQGAATAAQPLGQESAAKVRKGGGWHLADGLTIHSPWFRMVEEWVIHHEFNGSIMNLGWFNHSVSMV